MQVQEAVYYTKLLDIYGNILTAKQQSILTDYLCYDNTLSEIASAHNTTRQAVKDIIDRTCAKLDELEAKLHFCQKTQKVLDNLRKLTANITDSDTQRSINLIIKSMEV